MKILWKMNLVAVTLLGVAAAIPKIMRMPQEVQFFQSVGLGAIAVVAFGVLQLVGAGMLIPEKTRTTGAMLVAATFLGSAVMVLASGQLAFGAVSMLPVVLAALLARKPTP